jgi:hypothetical protein
MTTQPTATPLPDTPEETMRACCAAIPPLKLNVAEHTARLMLSGLYPAIAHVRMSRIRPGVMQVCFDHKREACVSFDCLDDLVAYVRKRTTNLLAEAAKAKVAEAQRTESLRIRRAELDADIRRAGYEPVQTCGSTYAVIHWMPADEDGMPYKLPIRYGDGGKALVDVQVGDIERTIPLRAACAMLAIMMTLTSFA